METRISKEGLISLVNDLSGIIRNIDHNNCYNMVVKFFGLTSTIDDHLSEIGNLPLKGVKLFGIKSRDRKQAEADRAAFVKEVRKAGRDLFGHNRTHPGEKVTNKNVYFGDVYGIWTLTVKKFEEKCKDNAYVQEHIRDQITSFVKSYQNSFNTNWLK